MLLEEGPFSEKESYVVVDGGHGFFLGSSGSGKRSVGILLHIVAEAVARSAI